MDPDDLAYKEADGRRMTVSGIVEDRSLTVYGYRLILDHLTFCPSGDSALQSRIARSLNQAINRQDRLQVFLSDGSGLNWQMYGEGKNKTLLWPDSDKREDQSELFESVRIGDRILLHGKCTLPERATNPGQFDKRLYCLARRIVLKMSEADLVTTDCLTRCSPLFNPVYGYRNFLADLRIGMQKGLKSVFGPEDASQAAAFLLGEVSGMEEDQKQLFLNGGFSYLVCVSSLPVSFLGMILFRLLRKKGISILLSAAVSFAAAGSYAVLTGFSLSAQRAFFTFALFLGAQLAGRTKDTLNALCAAAILILLRQPNALRDSSFLLSCVCPLSLEYLAPAVSRIFRPQMSWQKKLCGSFCLYLGSLPAALWFFYQTTPLTFLLCPVTLPLMGVILIFGLFGSLGGYLFLLTGLPAVSSAGRILAWPVRILVGVFRYLCMAQRKIPFSVLILGRPELWQVLAYYGALLLFVVLTGPKGGTNRCAPGQFFLSANISIPGEGLPAKRIQPSVSRLSTIPGRKRIRLKRMAVICLFGCLIWMVSLRRKPEFRYTCLDIGQGSCNLIEYDGCAYLFDAGSSSVENVWRYRIDSTLKYYGIRRLDMVFVSHGDMDHLNGLMQMLSGYEKDLAGFHAGDVTIGKILLQDLPSEDARLESVRTAAKENGIGTFNVMEGSRVSQGDMKLEILNPSPERITGDANEDCIVMLLTLKDLRILFTGDLEKEGEALFVKHYRKSPFFRKDPGKNHLPEDENKTMILIAGHHGSKNATSEELLELVSPDLVLISCGKNNRYGHPALDMLRRVEEAGAAYRRTDLDGAVVVTYYD